jgi:hypothetical protein
VTGSGGAGMLPPSMLVSSSVRFPPLQKVKKTEEINYNSHGNQETSTATIKKAKVQKLFPEVQKKDFLFRI